MKLIYLYVWFILKRFIFSLDNHHSCVNSCNSYTGSDCDHHYCTQKEVRKHLSFCSIQSSHLLLSKHKDLFTQHNNKEKKTYLLFIFGNWSYLTGSFKAIQAPDIIIMYLCLTENWTLGVLVKFALNTGLYEHYT